MKHLYPTTLQGIKTQKTLLKLLYCPATK